MAVPVRYPPNGPKAVRAKLYPLPAVGSMAVFPTSISIYRDT